MHTHAGFDIQVSAPTVVPYHHLPHKEVSSKATQQTEKGGGRVAYMVVSYGTGTMVWGRFCPVAAATVRAVRGVACTRFRWTVSTQSKHHISTPFPISRLTGLTALLLCLDPSLFVLLDTVEEDLTTLRVFDMLGADVYALLNAPVSDPLIDEDADRARSDVVDNARPAVGAVSTRKH